MRHLCQVLARQWRRMWAGSLRHPAIQRDHDEEARRWAEARARDGAGRGRWAVGCATFVRNPQAMLPEPHDKPTPDPDNDLEDDPEDEPKDKPDDEVEDDPRDEPDTLYFGREDGCTARCC